MPKRGEPAPERSHPGNWVGGSCAEKGSVFARLSPVERRRLKAWFDGTARESEDYIRSLLIR